MKAVVVGHIAVKKVVIVPADHSRVCPNTAEAALDMVRGDGVEGAPDIQERSKAVRAGIDVPFYVVR